MSRRAELDSLLVVGTVFVVVCELAACNGPECSAERTDECGGERPYCLVEEGRCVECLDAEGCWDGGRCIDWACYPEAAPDFTLDDVNPSSSSFGETFTLSEHFGEVVFVYFAALG